MYCTKKIKAELNKFNDNETDIMIVKMGGGFSALFINNHGIMTGTDSEVFLRIKQINRELGNDCL